MKIRRKEDIVFIANGIMGEKPGLTGGETRFIEIGKTWAKKGMGIHLVSSVGGKYICNKLGLRVKFHNNFSYAGVKQSRAIFIKNIIKTLWPPKSLKKFGTGVVYCSSEQFYDVIPGIVLKLRYFRTIKLVVVVHWLPPIMWWRRKNSSFLNSLFFLVSERVGLWLGLLFTDRVLPVSLSTKKRLLKDPLGRMFKKKVFAVNCGVDIERVREITKSAKKKEYDAVFMKRIQATKGIFDLIGIWEMVVRKIPDAKLIVIGSGIDEARAKSIVKERGLGKNIKFLGVIYDDKRKFTEIAKAKLFLLPSYEENWAIVIGEAMAAGVPVLAYRLDELVDVWKNNVGWISVGDKKEFVKKVVYFLYHKGEREKLSKKAFKYVRKFDWKAIATREIQIINGESAKK